MWVLFPFSKGTAEGVLLSVLKTFPRHGGCLQYGCEQRRSHRKTWYGQGEAPR